MHKFSYWQEGLVFASIFLVVLAIPCTLIAIFGSRLIYNLGQRPSNDVKAHMEMLLPLGLTMLLSFALLVAFYKYFSD